MVDDSRERHNQDDDELPCFLGSVISRIDFGS